MNLQKFDLTNRVSLITGSAGLLGKEHAKALLECGSLVVITDVNEHELEKCRDQLLSSYNKSSLISMPLDVTCEESVNDVKNRLEEQGLYVTILVNNAAIDPKVRDTEVTCELTRLENFSVDEWDKQLRVGLTGAFICSKIFGSEMAAQNLRGTILNIASDLSVISPDQRLYADRFKHASAQPVKPVTYSVIKAGLIGLTRYLSTYWADKDIRCNALSPGGIFNNQSREFVKNLCERIPLGRMAEVDEYHSAVQFLCSDASAYLNGQNIVMDGGRSVW